MALIIVLTLFAALSNAEYLRETYDWYTAGKNNDISGLHNLIQKEPKNMEIKSESCENGGCRLSLERNFNILTSKGFGINFYVDEMGYVNNTILVQVMDTTFNVTAKYKYTTPACKYFYRNAFFNYNQQKYANCKSGLGTDDFMSIAEMQAYGQFGVDIEVADRKPTLLDLGGWSEEAGLCGHWWPTVLKTCFEKALICSLKESFVLFALEPEIVFEMWIRVTVGQNTYDVVYEGNTNEMRTIEVSEGIYLDINPIGQLVNPINSKAIGAKIHYEKSNKTAKLESQWVYLDSYPDSGQIVSQGVGKFQLVNLNNIKSTISNKNNLNCDGTIQSCTKNLNRKLRTKQTNTGFSEKKLLDIYSIKNSDTVEDDLIIIAPNSSLQNLKGGDTCCIKLISPSERFLDSIVNNYEEANKVLMTKMPILPSSFKISVSGTPELDSFHFKNLLSVPILATLRTKDLFLPFSNKEFEITNLIISSMTYFENAAGSFFEMSFDYSGPPGNIRIDSKDINILTKELYISSSGKYTDTVGFKSKGIMALKPTICVGDAAHCVKPAKIINTKTKDGSVDDPMTGEEDSLINQITTMFKLYIANIWFCIFMTIIWLFDIVLSAVLIIIIVKLCGRSTLMLTVLCCSKRGESIETSKICELEKVGTLSSIIRFDHIVGVKLEKSMTDLSWMINDQMKVLSINMPTKSSLLEPKVKNFYHVGVANYSHEDGAHFLLPLYGANPWEIGTCDDDNDDSGCNLEEITADTVTRNTNFLLNLWNQVPRVTQFLYIKSTSYPRHHYDNGCSTYTVALISASGTSSYATILAYSTAYTGINLIEVSKFGNSKIFAVEVVAVASYKMNIDVVKNNVRSMIKADENVVISPINKQSIDAIGRFYFLITCPSGCVIYNPLVNKNGKAEMIKITDSLLKHQIYNDVSVFRSFWKTNKVNILSQENKLSKDIVIRYQNDYNKKFGLDDVKSDVESFINNKWYRYNLQKISDNTDSNGDITLDDNQLHQLIDPTSDFIMTDDGILDVTLNGPISMNCHSTGVGARCRHETGNMIAHFYNTRTDINKFGSFKDNGQSYKYEKSDYKVGLLPRKEPCKGKGYIDSQSRFLCSHDCCMVSTNNWNNYFLVSANKPFVPNRTLESINMWQSNKDTKLYFKSPYQCMTDTFSQTLDCALEKFSAEFYISVFIVPMFLIIYFIMLICCACVKKSYRYKKLGNSAKKGRWLIADMADNIMKGKPKFWIRPDNSYEWDDNDIGPYKRTTTGRFRYNKLKAWSNELD
ncbi:glycoprotein precursor [Sanxia Water Strider Virus 2]|uniref:Glycoprotein n=1 Tax=Sanxia Water Strider Virus 2 TaxID=1608061 RepID=A0A1L4AB04_9VIRU|nr:glycoprotein precursor [Sanxia Water Strider Virus 2]API65464.1 glycoprotein precursor [Sanxia Water Strider Virus 2]